MGTLTTTGMLLNQPVGSISTFQDVTNTGATLISTGQSAQTTADSVRKLRERSGLTWDELARIFGVSRRAVHNWANGGRMNSHNAERLEQIAPLIAKFDRGAPSANRATLLATHPSGTSPLGQLAAEARRGLPDRQLSSRLGAARPMHEPQPSGVISVQVLDIE